MQFCPSSAMASDNFRFMPPLNALVFCLSLSDKYAISDGPQIQPSQTLSLTWYAISVIDLGAMLILLLQLILPANASTCMICKHVQTKHPSQLTQIRVSLLICCSIPNCALFCVIRGNCAPLRTGRLLIVVLDQCFTTTNNATNQQEGERQITC